MSKFTPATVVVTRANRFAGEYPQEMPRFSESVIDRNPELQGLQTALTKWYFDFRTVLLRNISELELAVEALATKDETDESIAEVAGNITGQQTEIADILARLGALESDLSNLETGDAALQSEINQILVTIAGIQSQLADALARIDDLETFSFGLSGVTAGTYGATDTVGQFVVDAYGRITSATDIPIIILSGAVVNSHFVTSVTGTGGRISSSGGLTPVIDLVASGVAANTYGSASIVPVITVDTYGRITTAVDTPIAISAAAITSGTLPVDRGGTGAVTLTGILQGDGTSAITAITGTANYIPKWSATAPYLTATSLLFEDGTRVGVNTAVPRRPFHVSKDGVTVDPSIVGPSSTIYLTAELSTNILGILDSGGVTDASAIELEKTAGTLGAPTAVVDTHRIGRLVFTAWSGTTRIQGAEIRVLVDGAVGAAAMPTSMVFLTNNSGVGTTEWMRLKPNGALELYGIKTDASNYERLTVKHNASATGITLASEAAGTGTVRDMTFSGTARWGFGGAPTLGRVSIIDTGALGNGLYVQKTQTDSTAYVSACNYVMNSSQVTAAFGAIIAGTYGQCQIAAGNTQNWNGSGSGEGSSGAVGVAAKVEGRSGWAGTVTNAVGLLSVHELAGGTFTNAIGHRAINAVGTGTVTNLYGFYCNDLIKGGTLNIGFRSDVTSGTGKYHFYGSGTAASYFGGNVGVGTTIADRAMEINSATGINLRLTYNDSNGSATNFSDFLTDSSGFLIINPSGKYVGINQTVPAAVLHVNTAAGTVYSRGFQSRDGSFSSFFVGHSLNCMHLGCNASYFSYHTSSDMGVVGVSIPTNEVLRLETGVMTLPSTAALAWGIPTPDIFLYRSTVGALGLDLRNGTTGQVFKIFNTYTDAANYEMAFFGWSGNEFYLMTDQAGTGVARTFNLRAGSELKLGSNNGLRWKLDVTGNLLSLSDNGYNIGSAAARVKDIYIGGNLYLSGLSAGFLKGNGVSAVSSVATISVGEGGTGATTLTGLLRGNGTAAVIGFTGTTNKIPKFAAASPFLASSLITDDGITVEMDSNGFAATFFLDNAGGRGSAMGFKNSGVAFGYVGSSGIFEGDTSTDMGIVAETGFAIRLYTNGSAVERVVVDTSGRVGIGVALAPTAFLHIKAGTTAASSAPLKFNSGALMTAAEAGAVEFLTDVFHGTITTGAARKGFVMDDGARLTSGKIPIATTNGRLIDGQTPLAGTKVYYVADSSGGAVTRKLTFVDGILVSET